MAALGDNGRFTVPWMAAARAAKHAATAAAAAAAAAGRGFENIPILDIFTHVTTTLPAADVNALAKQFACRSTWRHAGRHAVRRVEERVWNGSAASDAGAKPLFGQVAGCAGDDTERVFSAAALHASDRRRPGAGGRRRRRHRRRRGDDGVDQGSVSFDGASLTALRDLASSTTTAAAKPDPIVLGHSKVEDGGALRRPEFFSVCDVAVFEEHEARLTALSEIPKGADLAFVRRLCMSCRSRLATCWLCR